MSEVLLHYSSRPVLTVRNRAQDSSLRTDKPQGFWVSVQGEQDWRQWCESEDYGIAPLAHRVRLTSNACIKRLSSAQDIDRLTAQHGTERGWGIDWGKVAAQYQGIIIAPYIWERRHGAGSSWYYTWDCASGCIWDAAAIASIERVPHLDPVNSSRLGWKTELTAQ